MKKRRVLFVVFPGFELLDMSGPAAVFSTANFLTGERLYDIVSVSEDGGMIDSAEGISVMTKPIHATRISVRDTVLATGGEEGPLDAALSTGAIADWLARTAKNAERFGSVCTGAFFVAAAGLLDGRRATTHWAGCQRLSEEYDAVSVDAQVIYISEGSVWTSAGVTAGIDMALAMVERDVGARVKGQIAKRLVVPAHRPGNQRQYSSVLEAQNTANEEFPGLVDWLVQNLDKPIKVGDMARRSAMSERSFFRKFTKALEIPPARFLENLRLDRAKELLEAGAPVKQVTGAVGFRSESGFRTAFAARFNMSPSMHRLMHS